MTAEEQPTEDQGNGEEPSTLDRKLADWITATGYALEMRVARAISDAGLAAVQSEGYRDLETSKLREIDVVAYEPNGGTQDDAFVIIPVECKRTRDRPWVLFSSPHHYTVEGRIQKMLKTGAAGPMHAALSKHEAAQDLMLFEMPHLVGYSLVSANLGRKKASSSNRAFRALSAVKSAAAGILESYSRFAAYVWPMLVLEGRLFQASLGVNGATDVAEIERGVLAWRQVETTMLVTVMTEEGLGNCVDTLAADVKHFASLADRKLKDRSQDT